MKQITKTNIFILVFIVFLLISLVMSFRPGMDIGLTFISFLKNMGMLLPPVFILIGLFEVWVKKETIEKHLGQDSGFSSYIYMILLASTMIGGIVVALPVAASLFHKGAKASVVYTFIFASAICRIPMTFFEASFMGLKFTLIRLLVSLPLIILASLAMEKIFPQSKLQIE